MGLSSMMDESVFESEEYKREMREALWAAPRDAENEAAGRVNDKYMRLGRAKLQRAGLDGPLPEKSHRGPQ